MDVVIMNLILNTPMEKVMKDVTAQEAYKAALVDVKAQMVELQLKLDNHEMRQMKDTKNWGMVGDLQRLRMLLSESLTAI
jgi:hypothetical protein